MTKMQPRSKATSKFDSHPPACCEPAGLKNTRFGSGQSDSPRAGRSVIGASDILGFDAGSAEILDQTETRPGPTPLAEVRRAKPD